LRGVFLLIVCLTGALAAAPAGAVTIAYPDLRVQVPTSEISIGQPNPTTRMLQFSHITWNAGAGPFEIRPGYNPATGISQGQQALYTYAGNGTWTFDRLAPVVGPMVWEPPSDYRFPLTKFWVYSAASGGGLGTLVATSPKVDFCMTADDYVGGVPNTPGTTSYPGSNCGSPTGTLGLDVGWGDKYDLTDGGENIDISGLPDGDYWLRAEVDPFHYIAESNRANDITDTELSIQGDTVSVIKQTHPNSTPPRVSLTSPAPGASVSGSVDLSATAAGPTTITAVQFLLDGLPLGPPVTSAPYTMTWNIGSTPPGPHYLSAQATDARGFIGTARAVQIAVPTPPIKIGSIAVDRQVTATGNGSVTTAAFSTHGASETLLAFAGSDGPTSGQTITVTGAGLTWHLIRRENAYGGDAEIWTASAASTLSNATVKATASTGGYDLSLDVISLTGASGIGASAAAGARSGAPTVTLTTQAAGSAVFATGNDYNNATGRVLGPGQAMLTQWLDTRTGDTYWSQYRTAPTNAPAQNVTLNDTSPTADMFNLVAVEALAAPAASPPAISIANPETSETLWGTVPVAANLTSGSAVSSVQFDLDGAPLGAPVTKWPYAIRWPTSRVTNGAHILTATVRDLLGRVSASTPVAVRIENPANPGPCFVMDVHVSADGAGPVTTATFHTAQPRETLLALVSANGPVRAGRQSARVSGGGLKWRLVRRANKQPGDAEIWQATATRPLIAARVTSIPRVGGFKQSLTVIAMQMTDGVGSSAGVSGAHRTPTAALRTTQPGSLVFGVGFASASAAHTIVGLNQMLLHQLADAGADTSFWAQSTSMQSGAAGSIVVLNDPAPAQGRWNLAAVELSGDGVGQ
jgi:hypothetical protein